MQVFKEADIHVVEHANVMEPIWGEFLVVCSAVVCALARLSVGALAKEPALRRRVLHNVLDAPR